MLPTHNRKETVIMTPKRKRPTELTRDTEALGLLVGGSRVFLNPKPPVTYLTN